MTSIPVEAGYEDLADRPLFGNGRTRPRDRTVNAVIVIITCLFVLFTTIGAFVPTPTSRGMFFVVCIIMVCSSHLTLLYWYKQGDLDPKFIKLVYYNTLIIILLCICANVFIH